MDAFLGTRVIAAIAAFAAVALTVLALAFLWEGVRGMARRRSVARELRRISEQSHTARGRKTEPGGLLREERDVPTWLDPLVGRVPGLTDIQLLLEQARSSWSVSSFLLLSLGLAFAFGVAASILRLGWIGGLAGAAVGAVIPYLLVTRRRAKRLSKFEEQFPDAIDLLARSARAGHALQSGLREVGEESSDPAGEEFRQVFEEQKFGLPLAESFQGLVERIDLVDVRMFVTSVLIQKETGGNLAENLDNLAHIIRERFQFQRQIKVHTAHGRMTGRVLAAAPLVGGLGLYAVAPHYMTTLFTEPAGRWMIAVSLVLQFFGFLIIRRITDLDF